MLIAINTFSFYIADKFRHQIVNDGTIIAPEVMCQSYLGCFLNTINIGLRAGGGISDFMNKVTEYKSENYF